MERRSYVGLFSRTLSRLLHQCLIVSMPLRHKEDARTREVSITQLLIETIISPVGKSDPSFDLQAEIIFGGNGGAMINKFLDCVKSIVIDRNPRISNYRKIIYLLIIIQLQTHI